MRRIRQLCAPQSTPNTLCAGLLNRRKSHKLSVSLPRAHHPSSREHSSSWTAGLPRSAINRNGIGPVRNAPYFGTPLLVAPRVGAYAKESVGRPQQCGIDPHCTVVFYIDLHTSVVCGLRGNDLASCFLPHLYEWKILVCIHLGRSVTKFYRGYSLARHFEVDIKVGLLPFSKCNGTCATVPRWPATSQVDCLRNSTPLEDCIADPV